MSKSDTGLQELLAALASKPDASLVFFLGDAPINQGYHVTEIKHANIKSMDCAKHVDAWEELVIQLLDGVSGSQQGFLSTGKFTNIVNSALDSCPDHSSPRLYFEFNSNNGPLLKLKIDAIGYEDGALSIYLAGQSADCKPFQRWGMSGMAATVLGHCSPEKTKTQCCSSISRCCS